MVINEFFCTTRTEYEHTAQKTNICKIKYLKLTKLLNAINTMNEKEKVKNFTWVNFYSNFQSLAFDMIVNESLLRYHIFVCHC